MTTSPPILVTGVGGFIGRELADRLLTGGFSVVGVDSLENPLEPELTEARLGTLRNRPGFNFEQIDLADRTASDALFRSVRPEVILHLAARAGVRASLEE